jgi:hypothetical protein
MVALAGEKSNNNNIKSKPRNQKLPENSITSITPSLVYSHVT